MPRRKAAAIASIIPPLVFDPNDAFQSLTPIPMIRRAAPVPRSTRRLTLELDPATADMLQRLAGDDPRGFVTDLIHGAGLAQLDEQVTGRLVGLDEDVAHILIHGPWLLIRTPFESDYIEEIKTVAGRRWDKLRRIWIVPASEWRNVREIVARYFLIETDIDAG